MNNLIKEALAVGKKYPVFPTDSKIPCWSNAELNVEKGKGGYQIATQDPARIKELFSHPNAKEIAVPMGAMSGLMCVDVDLYKSPELVRWLGDQAWLQKTRSHKTRSGGLHFIFRHTETKLPATMRTGVDIKANGAGYICFPPTEGYSILNKQTPKLLPKEIEQLILSSQPNGNGGSTSGSFNSSPDTELIERVQRADELYPALRTLSYRLPTRRKEDGAFYSREEQVTILNGLMTSSDAASLSHPRHEDWRDRLGKIPELVASANRKQDSPVDISDTIVEQIMEGKSFLDTQRIIAASIRPTGPQQETTISDIETVAEALNDEADEYVSLTADSLLAQQLPPIEWLIKSMIPIQGTISLGGTSNVGKTRWLAALCTALAVGKTERMGLPSCNGKHVSLWFANEERRDDIARRVKATVLQHGDKNSAAIVVRGKDKGMMRLVAVNEIGTPEIDTKNVARIVKQARLVNAKFIVLDPYVTLSDAMDENSAVSAGMLTKAFILIATATGAAVCHAHHTPKDRNKDADWYRGDSGAWRGSGAIYSALDCGYTLSHWMPRNHEQRKAWRNKSLEMALTRWVVLDTGKIREGEPLPPTVYELTGQEMQKGEGEAIGVCTLRTEQDAANVLLDGAVDIMYASELAEHIGDKLGYGQHTKLSLIQTAMKDDPLWPVKGDRIFPRDLEKLYLQFETPIHWSGGTLCLELNERKKTNGRWLFNIEKEKTNDSI
jgi:hypothetical protein